MDEQSIDNGQPATAHHAPWYESNILWVPVSLGVGTILTVVAAAKHDLRWLLIFGWVCFGIAAWFVARRFRAWLWITIIAVTLLGGAFSLMNSWLKPAAAKQAANQSPLPEAPTTAPTPAAPITRPAPVQPTRTRKQPPTQTATGTDNAQVGGGVNAGPCSNVQIGGRGNQGRVNCSSIPFRILTESQKQAIKTLLDTFPPSVLVTIGGIYGSGDAANYALDLFPLFEGRHLGNQTTPAIRTGFPTTWTNVFVATCSDDDSASQYRDALVRTLNSLGIQARAANGSKVAPGNLEILVGFRPEEVKPQ